ncbi:MAG: DDE-type integrase/transposase/recombinase [Verrucomicrobiia bacterium]
MKTRRRCSKVIAADQTLLEPIQKLKTEHPAWGYRRIWAYLRYRQNRKVGKNRIYRLLKENILLATQTRQLKASRSANTSKPKTTQPNRIWGIDMTKIMINSWGWVYLVVVLDWGSKKVVGWDLSLTSKTADWLEALDKALYSQFANGLSEQDKLQLVSDNGSQPTSTRFISSCSLLGIEQIFTSYCNPKGNAETERVFRTLKEDLIWLQDWLSVEQLRSSLTHLVP